MDNTVFKYSEFFEDDGGLENVKKDFVRIGDDIIKEAERIKKEVAEKFNFGDLKALGELEKQAESISDVFETYGKAKKKLDDVTKKVKKSQDEEIANFEKLKTVTNDYIEELDKKNKAEKAAGRQTQDTTKNLDELYIVLEQHRVAMKLIEEMYKAGQLTEEKYAKAKGRAKFETAKVTKEIREQEKALAESNQITKEMDKNLKKEIKTAKERAEMLDLYNDVLKRTKKIQEDNNKSSKQSERTLSQLYVEQEKMRTVLKDLNKVYKSGQMNEATYAKLKGETTLQLKKLTSEITKNQKEVLDSNKVSKEEQKLAEARQVLLKEEVRNRTELRERIKALRIVVDSLDFKTQQEDIRAMNKEINDLTDLMSENSDKFIQSKINIGNYEESITNALKNTGLFNTQIGALDDALNGLFGILTKSTEEIAEMEQNMDQNTGAVKRFTVAFGKLNRVLKASIIGAILVAVAALGSAFGNTRAGAVRLEKVMKTFSTTLASAGKIATAVVKGIGEAFSIFFETIEKVFTDFEGKSFGQLMKDFFTGDFVVKDLMIAQAKQFQNIKKTIQDVVDAGKNGAEAITKGLANIDRAYQLEDTIRGINREIEVLNGKLALAQMMADDSTRSLNAQLQANRQALNLTEQIGEKRLQAARAELEMQNELVKQSILANDVEASRVDLSKQGMAFAEDILVLAKERGVQLEIDNALIESQQTAVLDLIAAENDLATTREDNAKKAREINRDIFEQNLDLLIDLIDTQKNISEQFVNDVTKNFQNRINEFYRFLQVFRTNSQKELDEFTKQASNMGLDLDFQIQYDENGDFKVFVNDMELAMDNIVELNRQLQSTGMNEIDINRFREFMVETRNGVRDFRMLNKEIDLVAINVREMTSNIGVSEDELKKLAELEERIRTLSASVSGDLNEQQREQVFKQIEDLEKEREAITRAAEESRLANRKAAIDEELALVEEGSTRYYELIQERLDIEKQLRDNSIEGVLDSTKEANKRALEDYKKWADEVKGVLNAVMDKVLEINRKRVEAAKDQVKTQEDLIDRQRERAEAGLENTFAFEQRMLGKREAELIKQQKRQERLEKVRAIYSSYNNYSSRGDENPIAKALRDFAILEAITASFGDGGIVEDKLAEKNRGIIRGRSHQGRQGGIPVLVEGEEGIFSKREMKNLGKENFYKMKDLAGLGKVDSNFFSKQREGFVQAVPVSQSDPALLKEVREMKQAIESKPSQNWDMRKVTDGVYDLVETVISKNSVKRNHYRTKKPRI